MIERIIYTNHMTLSKQDLDIHIDFWVTQQRNWYELLDIIAQYCTYVCM